MENARQIARPIARAASSHANREAIPAVFSCPKFSRTISHPSYSPFLSSNIFHFSPCQRKHSPYRLPTRSAWPLVPCQLFHMHPFLRFFAQNFSVLLSEFISNFFNAITAFFSFPYLPHLLIDNPADSKFPDHLTLPPTPADNSFPPGPLYLVSFFTCTRSAAFCSKHRLRELDKPEIKMRSIRKRIQNEWMERVHFFFPSLCDTL